MNKGYKRLVSIADILSGETRSNFVATVASFITFTGAKKCVGTYLLMKATFLPHDTEDAIKLYMTSPYFKDVEVLIPPGAETYQLISSVDIEKVFSARPVDFRHWISSST